MLNESRFFRDATRAKIAGVCAGIAKNIDVNPWLIRAGAVISFIILPFATALAYVLAILLLRCR